MAKPVFFQTSRMMIAAIAQCALLSQGMGSTPKTPRYIVDNAGIIVIEKAPDDRDIGMSDEHGEEKDGAIKIAHQYRQPSIKHDRQDQADASIEEDGEKGEDDRIDIGYPQARVRKHLDIIVEADIGRAAKPG